MGALNRVRGSVTTDAGAGSRTGTGRLAIVGPATTGATVGPNNVREHSDAEGVKTDFGSTSPLYAAAKEALKYAQSVLVIEAAHLTDSGVTGPFTETKTGTSQTGTLDADRDPITRVTAVKRDSVAITGTINYTATPDIDPSGETVAANDVLINPWTGAYKLGTAPTTDAEFTYESHDWTKAFEKLDQNAYEIHIPAFVGNKQLIGETAGVYKKFQEHAATAHKLVVGVLTSGVTPASAKALVTAMRHENMRMYFDYYASGEEATAAHAALLSTIPVNGTTADQPAPTTLTRTQDQTYVAADIGDLEDPATDTIGELGAVATYRDEAGVWRYTSDRHAQAKTAFYRDTSTWRIIRDTRVSLENALTDLRRAGPNAVPFNGRGRAAVIGALKGVVDDKASREYIDPVSLGALVVPKAESLSSTDRKNRIWKGLVVPVRAVTQAEIFDIRLNARV